PLTARGGGTSQAGQSIGPGLILDASKHFNAILEIDPDGRSARVRPGGVVADPNPALPPHKLKFAPDISTPHRAALGGMGAKHSRGAGRVLWGKAGDPVLGLRVVLSDGSVIDCRPLDGPELEERSAREDLEGACYRAVRRLAAEHAEEIERRYPKILRRV